MGGMDRFTMLQVKLLRSWDMVTGKSDILKMRKLSYQGDVLRGMPSAFGVVVGVCMNMGVGNSRSANNMSMRKKRYGGVISHKKCR